MNQELKRARITSLMVVVALLGGLAVVSFLRAPLRAYGVSLDRRSADIEARAVVANIQVYKDQDGKITPTVTVHNSAWKWVTVKNPYGAKNGNGSHEFGEDCGIKEGGLLTAFAIADATNIFVRYEAPGGQGYGSECGNFTVFKMRRADFETNEGRYQQIIADREAEKERIRKILK